MPLSQARNGVLARYGKVEKIATMTNALVRDAGMRPHPRKCLFHRLFDMYVHFGTFLLAQEKYSVDIMPDIAWRQVVQCQTGDILGIVIAVFVLAFRQSLQDLVKNQ